MHTLHQQKLLRKLSTRIAEQGTGSGQDNAARLELVLHWVRAEPKSSKSSQDKLLMDAHLHVLVHSAWQVTSDWVHVQANAQQHVLECTAA